VLAARRTTRQVGLLFRAELGLLVAQEPLARATAMPSRVRARVRSTSISVPMDRVVNRSPPDRIGRVVQRAADVQPHSAGSELIDDVAGVGHGAGESIELGDDQGVAAAGGDGSAKAGSVAVGAGQAVVDVVAFRVDGQCDERVMLRGEVLIDGRDSGVPILSSVTGPVSG